MLILAMLACDGPEPIPRPDGVPKDAVHIAFDGERLTLDGAEIAGFGGTDLTDGLHAPLSKEIPAGSKSVWITAPPTTEWLYVRKLFLTARESGVAQIWLGLAGAEDAFQQPGPNRASLNNTCKSGPLTVVGIDTSLSLNIQTGTDGTWARGSARFRPIVEKGSRNVPIIDLPPSCWALTTCSIFDERTASACEEALVLDPLAARVPIASEVGCLLPIIKGDGDAAKWRRQLAEVLDTLKVSAETETLLMVEAKAPWESVTSVLGAFADEKIRQPSLGTPLLEGHDGPPICDAPIRDADTLKTARGTWLGSQLHQE
jgi:hypothetical protein